MTGSGGIDRYSLRKRPDGVPVMHQSWRKLLFMHYRLAPELLHPHVPAPLEIDTFDGEAWIGVTPFTIRNSRPSFLPPLPLVSDFHEINVRTYVHYDGVPGVWFFSLDASSILAVLGAWTAYHLPYHTAQMQLREEGARICYKSRRLTAPQPVEFEAVWEKRELLGEARPESLEYFLVERYCLYAVRGRDLYRARIFHPPWELRRAALLSCRSTMIEGQGLPSPSGTPLLHYAEMVDAAIWPVRKVREAGPVEGGPAS